ncbi:CTLH/CRA C-terminal to lish motif domain-containing protein [Cyathus striatus]|nr:CTLH/CRA C-terminal to lish motif domain-containing protein [Cyathus striatus]
MSKLQTPSNPLFGATPEQLRDIVIDYLCHNCYTNTARAFVKDSSVRQLDADGDEVISSVDEQLNEDEEITEEFLKQVERRQEIRRCILAGNVDDATDLIHKHFPSILPDTSSPEVGSDNSTVVASPPPSDLRYLSATSVDPMHLSLNLRILAFTEACRTIPLEYPADIKLTVKWDSSSSIRLQGEDDPKYLEQQVVLLQKLQKLYAYVQTLPNAADGALYMKELEHVSGLLAYKVPEKSSMSKYLSMERREAVADQINRAILQKLGKAPISSVELYTRYTHILWELANQSGINSRPGVMLPPVPRTSSPIPSKSDNESQVVPNFDLKQLLDLKP